jgi:hypothetical protein
MKKNILLLVYISFFIIIPSNVNGQSKKYVIGIHSGYSFFLKKALYESYGPYSEYKGETKLGLHGGFNLQYHFSAKWAIQLEMDYQRKTLHEERTDFVSPEYSYSRVDNYSYTVYYLNLIYKGTHKRNKLLSWYISAGVGIEDVGPLVLYSKMGNGIRYSFSPHTALHLGISFSPVPFIYLGPLGFRLFPSGIMYFSLYVGLEYGF